MAEGRGGFVAVSIIGLVTISGAAGAYLASSLSPLNTFPKYVSTPEGASAEDIKAAPTKQPCENMITLNEADLCAQYRAASAAEHGSFWSFVQMVLSAAGLIGLFITLWYNRKALRIARSSQADARLMGQAQVRSYLDLTKPTFCISEHGIMSVSFKLKNVGQSPAIQASIKTSVRVGGLLFPEKEIYDCVEPRKFPAIMSGDKVTVTRHPCEKGLSAKAVEALEKNPGSISLLIVIEIEFRDVFKVGQKIKKGYVAIARKKDEDNPLIRIDEYKAILRGEVAKRKHLGVWKGSKM